jgi:hypothetical protein
MAACGYHPAANVPEETVDLIEINHLYDEHGHPVFDQVLFYDWSAAHGRYQLRDWRLLKSPNQIPLPSAKDREYVSVWNDFKAGDTVRATKSRIVRETWTQFDPELAERDFLPADQRRKLSDVPMSRKAPAAASGPQATRPAASAARGSKPLRPLQNPAPRREPSSLVPR